MYAIELAQLFVLERLMDLVVEVAQHDIRRYPWVAGDPLHHTIFEQSYVHAEVSCTAVMLI